MDAENVAPRGSKVKGIVGYEPGTPDKKPPESPFRGVVLVLVPSFFVTISPSKYPAFSVTLPALRSWLPAARVQPSTISLACSISVSGLSHFRQFVAFETLHTRGNSLATCLIFDNSSLLRHSTRRIFDLGDCRSVLPRDMLLLGGSRYTPGDASQALGRLRLTDYGVVERKIGQSVFRVVFVPFHRVTSPI